MIDASGTIKAADDSDINYHVQGQVTLTYINRYMTRIQGENLKLWIFKNGRFWQWSCLFNVTEQITPNTWVRNIRPFYFISSLITCEKFWSAPFSEGFLGLGYLWTTTNDPDEIQSHDPLTMSRRLATVSPLHVHAMHAPNAIITNASLFIGSYHFCQSLNEILEFLCQSYATWCHNWTEINLFMYTEIH